MLIDMYNMIAREIQDRQGKPKVAEDAALPVAHPRIDEILERQEEIYHMLKTPQEAATPTGTSRSSQLDQLITLGERFFEQMQKDNLEIRKLIATEEPVHVKNSFVDVIKKIKHSDNDRQLALAHTEISQLKSLLGTEREVSLAEEIIRTRKELAEVRKDLEELQTHHAEETEKLEDDNVRLETLLSQTQDQLVTKTEALDVIKAQLQITESQMRYELESKLETIQEMESEITTLSEKLTVRDDLHEIGHYVMSEMREQQLLSALEETKSQLLETMDELEDVSDALHRETMTNRELQQMVAIKEEKIKLLQMTIDDLRMAYDSSSTINLNIDFNREQVQRALMLVEVENNKNAAVSESPLSFDTDARNSTASDSLQSQELGEFAEVPRLPVPPAGPLRQDVPHFPTGCLENVGGGQSPPSPIDPRDQDIFTLESLGDGETVYE